MKLGNSRFRIELDESSALDVRRAWIGDLEISPGAAVPDDGDARILHAVSGFMFTCGPDHVRHPEEVEGLSGERYPLHGSLSGNRPQDVIVVENSVECKIDVEMPGGGRAQVRRRWTFEPAETKFQLSDTLVNDGADPFSPMWMYHINLGTRNFDHATRLGSESFDAAEFGWRFGPGEGHVFCVPARAADRGEASVFVGPFRDAGGTRLKVAFGTDTLPHLQMWRNEAGHCDVIGIEPISHPWKKRPELHALGLMAQAGPGEERHYRVAFSLED